MSVYSVTRHMLRRRIVSEPHSPQPEHTPVWALLIGINHYQSTVIRDLRGCRNDIVAMHHFLTNNLMVPERQIVTLLNEEGTREGILNAFQGLINHAEIRKGDQIIIHYSGHGVLMRPPLSWGVSGFVQAIVPYDAQTGQVYCIPDRTLGALLDQLAERFGDNITVILDSCHSASSTRELHIAGMPLVRRAEPDLRLPSDSLDAEIIAGRSGRNVGPSGWASDGMPYVLLAGCRDREQSNEYQPTDGTEDNWYGALTFFTLKLLRELASAGTWTYTDLQEQVAAQVNACYPLQMPQCEGEGRNRIVFGSQRIARDPWILVDSVNGNQVTLRAGLIHGCGPGARIHLYTAHPGLRTSSDLPKEPVAVAEIVSATATTAHARLTRVAGQIMPLDRGIIVVSAYTSRPLRVLLPSTHTSAAPVLSILSAAITALGGGLVELQVDSAGAFDLYVVEDAGVLSIYSNDGGLLVQPEEASAVEAMAATTLRALQSIARYRALQALASSSDAKELVGKIQLNLHRVVEDAAGLRLMPLPEVRIGEHTVTFDPAIVQRSRFIRTYLFFSRISASSNCILHLGSRAQSCSRKVAWGLSGLVCLSRGGLLSVLSCH